MHHLIIHKIILMDRPPSKLGLIIWKEWGTEVWLFQFVHPTLSYYLLYEIITKNNIVDAAEHPMKLPAICRKLRMFRSP